MNCDLLQRRLISLERPDRPPAEVQSHLAACPTCREWHGRLVRLEQDVRLLPVPVSTARATFVARLRAGETALVGREETAVPSASLPRSRGQRRERALRKLALATALAAGLALFALGWWAAQWSQKPGPGKPQDLVAQLVQHDLDLAKDTKEGTRLQVLAAMANDLHAQAKPLVKAKQGEDLQVLAACYEEAIGALPDQVHELQETELGKLAQRLRNVARETKDLATAADEDCAASLARMASAAQNAADRLQGMAPRAQRPHAAGGCVPGSPLLCAGGSPGGASALLTGMVSRVLLTSVVSATQLSEPADLAPWFHKNRDLIRKLVHAGVFLAGHYGDPNALERARCCNGLAVKLADEMQTAADRQEGGRMAALGQYLGSLLEDGVADNLTCARRQGKFSEKDLQEVGSDTDKLLIGLPEQLQKLQDPQLAPSVDTSLNALRAGREKVQKALAR